MPIPTIPLWEQLIKNGINNIRNIWKTSKERYNSMTPEQKAEAARVGNQWVTDNILPVVTSVGELIPQTSIPMAAYNASDAVKRGNYEEAFQHVLTPVLTGSVSKGINLGLNASEKAIDTAVKVLKNADNYVTIQNALRTGKLKFGEPTTYTGIHQSKTPLIKVQFPFQRWDVTTHGADPNGFWLTLADSPNTTGTMASRPYASRWSATSQKPLIQTGEVKSILGKKNNTRNAIVQYGKKHGADAFEFRGIRDNAVPQTDVVMVTEGTNPQYLGGVGQVRYAGPTTGKSTFIKTNSESGFVDLDVVPGYKQLRKDIADQLGLDWKDPKVTDSPEYQQAFNNFIKEWAQNTENSGKTLFGSAKGLLRGDNHLTGRPFIPDFETFVARNQARGFKENPEQLRAWYNSIIDSYPEIKIDNRFVGEIPLPYNAPKTSIKSIQMEEPIMSELIDLDNIGKSAKITLSDPEKYWYVAHQTGSANFPKIMQSGLQTTNGLNGTALHLTEDYANVFGKGLLKKNHLSHEGADGMIIMKFPKSKFPSGDLDDISIRLMELGESKNFEVPTEYLTFLKKTQLKQGGKIKSINPQQ